MTAGRILTVATIFLKPSASRFCRHKGRLPLILWLPASDSCSITVTPRRDEVAQISNLLYRRFPTCRALPFNAGMVTYNDVPIGIRRYGRLEICATLNAHPSSGNCHFIPVQSDLLV